MPMTDQDTWQALVERWLREMFPALAAQNAQLSMGERGVMMVSIDADDMQQMLAGAPLMLDPAWRPVGEFVRMLRTAPRPMIHESPDDCERRLGEMDPQQDVALFVSSKTPDAEGKYFTRLVVSERGRVPVH
jgi:hypothetical protein